MSTPFKIKRELKRLRAAAKYAPLKPDSPWYHTRIPQTELYECVRKLEPQYERVFPMYVDVVVEEVKRNVAEYLKDQINVVQTEDGLIVARYRTVSQDDVFSSCSRWKKM